MTLTNSPFLKVTSKIFQVLIRYGGLWFCIPLLSIWNSTFVPPLLRCLALGLLLPPFCLLCLLLSLYPGLALLMLAGLPPLNSLGMLWRQVGNHKIYCSYMRTVGLILSLTQTACLPCTYIAMRFTIDVLSKLYDLSFSILKADQLLMPFLVLLNLLQCFARKVQFGLFSIGWLPTVLCPDL